MNIPHKSVETYSERSLNETLAFAAADLAPGKGYSLTLEGILPSMQTHEELEEFFGKEIDASAGATITLTYDELNEKLVIENLSLSLKRGQGTAQLLKTESIGYIPVVFSKSGTPFLEMSKFLSYDQAQLLQKGFGIGEAPLGDSTRYRKWLSSLLSITQGWKLSERLEIPMAVSESAAASYILQSEQIFDSQNQSRIDTKIFTRSLLMFDESTDAVHHTESNYEHVTADLESAYSMAYTKSFTSAQTPDVFLGEIQTDHILKKLEMSLDTYNETINNLREFIEIRHKQALTRPTGL
jgi:hypothetical protein